MESIECDWCEMDWEEDLHSVWMTRNEIMFLDDSLTMMIERDSMNDNVTTMRVMQPSAQLPAPVTLLDKLGMAVLRVTDPDKPEKGTEVCLNDSEVYMLRELCHSYCRVGGEQVGYNLKRKLYLALYKETYERDRTVANLLSTVDFDMQESTPQLDK